MANVAFKRGSSANLPIGNAVDGVFYLTTDTNRLYVGNSNKQLVDLNRYIRTVASVSALYPSTGVDKGGLAAGDFVWIADTNMLLVCVNPNGQTLTQVWTQINPPDTDSDTKVTGLTLSDSVDATNNKITITLTLDQTTTTVEGGKTYTSPAQLKQEIEISKEELKSILDTSVGIEPTSISGGGAKITPIGEGSNNAEFVNLKQGENITITVSGNDVTISAKDTRYNLMTEASANTGIVVLHPLDESGDEKVTFQSGNDALVVTSDDDGNVVYTHKVYNGTASAVADGGVLTHGGEFTAVTAITTDKGHVTKYQPTKFVLPSDNNTTYSVSAANVTENSKSKLVLTAGGTGSGDDNIYFAAGEDLTVNTSGSAGNETITYTHKDYGDLSASDSNASGAEIAPAHGGKFTVVDAITASNGHITGYTTKEVTLPTDNNTTNTSADVSVNGGNISITVTDSNGGSVTDTESNALYHKITIDGTETTVYNQSSLGSFYSASKVDEKLNAVDAMTYKGTVGIGGTVTELPTTNVKVGDTYKVVTAGTWGTHACDVGDLLIAMGIESDGVIIASDLEWTYVPSGDDTDTHYDISVGGVTDAATLILGNSVTEDEDIITFVGDTAIDITPDTANSKITVKHENVTRSNTSTTETPIHGGTFTAVKSVESNDQGHVTKVVTTTVTLPSDNNTTYTHAFNADNQLVLTGVNPASSDPVDFIAGNDIVLTSNATGNTSLTIAHETFTTTPSATVDADPLTHGGTFTAITAITADNGHVTGYQPTKFTLPSDNNTTYSLDLGGAHSITLNGSDGSTDKISLGEGTGAVAGNYIQLSDDADTHTINIAHKAYTATTLGSTETTNASLAHGDSLTAIVGVTRDSGGHLSGVKTRTFTLPSDNNTTYDLSGGVAQKTENAVTVTTTLTSSNPAGTDDVAFDIASNSLEIVANSNAIAINMVWGTF